MAGAGVAGCRQTLPPASRPWISGLRACVLLWFCAPPSPVSVPSLKGPRSPALHQPVGHPSLDHTPVSRDPVIILPLGEAKVGRLFRILLWIVLNLGYLGRGLCPAVLVDNLIQTPAHSPEVWGPGEAPGRSGVRTPAAQTWVTGLWVWPRCRGFPASVGGEEPHTLPLEGKGVSRPRWLLLVKHADTDPQSRDTASSHPCRFTRTLAYWVPPDRPPLHMGGPPDPALGRSLRPLHMGGAP